MADEADLGCDRAEEIRESQIARQLNAAHKTRLEPRPDGTCLNECGEAVEVVTIEPTPQAVAAAAATGVPAKRETRKSFFCSKECAEDHGDRERRRRALGLRNAAEAN